MGPSLRYTLIQLPEAALVGSALVAGYTYGWLSLAVCLTLAGVWGLKELALYPLYRRALMPGPASGAAALVWRRARVVSEINPTGQIRVQGEYWRAVSSKGHRLSSGTLVRVVDARGLTLVVSTEDATPGSTGEAGTGP